MKVIVCVKRVVDNNAVLRIKPDGTDVDTSNVKMAMNPFDEVAMEEAVRLKEAGLASEIVAVSIGDKASQDVLRTALAMGADKALLIETLITPQPLAVAKLLRVIIQRENPGLVLLGKQSSDADNNQTGQMLAALLGWSQGTFASRIEFSNDELLVTREIDGGVEQLSLKLPSVVTTDLQLNIPRYIKLTKIMQAKKMPLEIIDAEKLGVDIRPRIHTVMVEEPPKRGLCIKVSDVNELVVHLQSDTRVIL